MRLSPESMRVLAICPRQFQHLYVDQLTVPVPREQQQQVLQHHRLQLRLRQVELGLPIPDAIAVSEDVAVQQAVSRLLTAVPELTAEGVVREGEHQRTVVLHNHRLTVSYDWVIWDDQQAQILVWSTDASLDPSSLAQDWQSRLALFVLAETSSYTPEQLSLTHWTVPLVAERLPTAYPLSYSTAQHQQTQAELIHWLNDLTYWLQQYDAGTAFPQTPDLEPCFACAFARRCQRGPFSPDSPHHLPELTNIEEVPLG
ncbi:MAG: PD-(D/E)XK nuclease family protein [Synechococcales cyanobacterium M58_A2018_015]|nr:PD-(D/E)XK nuclease family protein [Synechococcales cyanobacterium M58_A2018_015]